MNRRRKLLIPLLFCGAMLTACDDKSAENAAAMTPEVGVVTLSPGSVNVLSELPGRTVPYEVAEIRPQVGGIIIKRNFIETPPKARWRKRSLPPAMPASPLTARHRC